MRLIRNIREHIRRYSHALDKRMVPSIKLPKSKVRSTDVRRNNVDEIVLEGSHVCWLIVAFFLFLQKVELHVHLDGALRLTTIIDLARFVKLFECFG
jgi:hypothetical protein